MLRAERAGHVGIAVLSKFSNLESLSSELAAGPLESVERVNIVSSAYRHEPSTRASQAESASSLPKVIHPCDKRILFNWPTLCGSVRAPPNSRSLRVLGFFASCLQQRSQRASSSVYTTPPSAWSGQYEVTWCHSSISVTGAGAQCQSTTTLDAFFVHVRQSSFHAKY